nr:ankyrin repeat protein [Hymenolepis microstoma]
MVRIEDDSPEGKATSTSDKVPDNDRNKQTANNGGKIPMSNATKLAEAISRNSHSDIARLLKEDLFDETTLDRAIPLLNYVASHGNLFCVQLLVEKGCPFMTRDRGGYLALSLAAKNGHLNVVAYLMKCIEKTGEPYEKEYREAICFASYMGHLSIVELLLDHYGDICYGLRNPHRKRNALIAAVIKGDIEEMDHLLSAIYGSYHLMKYKSGLKLNTLEGIRVLIALAVAKRNSDVVRRLLEWVDEYEPSEYRNDEDMYEQALGIDRFTIAFDMYTRIKQCQ